MQAHESIAPHDAVGANIELHTFRKEVVRCVPRENDSINECWLSDRDRFSYQGIYSKDRLTKPMLKRDGQLVAVTWQEALQAAAEILRSADSSRVAALANPTSTLEELYLFQRLMRGLNIRNIDHRLRQVDFSDQANAPISPTLGVKIAELEQQNAVLLIGSNIRQEQPLLNHRLRKAALKGAKITALNPRGFDFNYVAEQIVAAPSALVAALAGLAKASLEANQAAMPAELANVLNAVDSNDAQRATVAGLKEAANKLVLLGNLAVQHPAYAILRALASVIAAQTGAKLGYLPESANTVGAWLAGVVPHRLSAGRDLKQTGSAVNAVLPNASTIVLLNAETADFANPAQAAQALTSANNVIVIGAFADQAVLDRATVILPGSTFAETAGTYCNAEGTWQTFQGATEPLGDARPTWKILRVLGNAAGVHEFDWVNAEEVAAELKAELFEETGRNNAYTLSQLKAVAIPAATNGQFERVAHVQLYREDGLVRRATALQEVVDAAVIELNPNDAANLGVQAGDQLQVSQADTHISLPVRLSTDIAVGTVGLAAGYEATAALNAFGLVQLSKVG
jgi:NADH-quinone oxidoreductase subunit G